MSLPRWTLLLALVAGSASAQPLDLARLAPLGEGDVWTYAVERAEWAPGDAEPGDAVVLGTEVVAVLPDTLVNGELFHRLVREATDADGAVERDSCTFQRTPSGDVSLESGCSFASRWNQVAPWLHPNGPAPDGVAEDGATFELGRGTLETVTTAWYVSAAAHGNGWRYDYAYDVGLWRDVYTERPRYSNAGYVHTLRLVSATVGGVAYTAPEPEFEPGPESLVTQVWPNPTRRDVTLRFQVPRFAFVHVVVRDVLGRAVLQPERVFPGEEEITLDLASVAPGAYLVTALDETGRSATVRVVRR